MARGKIKETIGGFGMREKISQECIMRKPKFDGKICSPDCKFRDYDQCTLFESGYGFDAEIQLNEEVGHMYERCSGCMEEFGK